MTHLKLAEMVHRIDTPDQHIYMIGSPGESIEVRFANEDDEVLLTVDDGSETSKLWIHRGEVEDLMEALQKVLDTIS